MIDTEDRPYCIIDILPERVPSDSPGRYFEVERYFRSRLDEIIRKFASFLNKLNCYCELEVSRDCETFSGDFAPEDLERFLLKTNASPQPLLHPCQSYERAVRLCRRRALPDPLRAGPGTDPPGQQTRHLRWPFRLVYLL